MSSSLPLLLVVLMFLPLLAALFFIVRIRARFSSNKPADPNARPSLNPDHFSLTTNFNSQTLGWHASVQNGDQQLEFDHPSELIGYLQDFDGEVAKTALENTKNQLKTMLKDIQK